MSHPDPQNAEPQWQEANLQNPHAVADKAQRVRKMFAAIARSYDLNNRLHSMGRDQAWRRRAVKLCGVQPDEVVLDVACGTGDLSIAFAKAGARRVVGVDFTHEMVQIAMEKGGRSILRPVAPAQEGEALKGKNGPVPFFVDGDAMRLPVGAASADVVSIAFGIRNVADPAAAMREFRRVLRPGGRVCILEFSTPTHPLLRAGYMLYFKRIMPCTATIISGDRSGAYKYLPQSVNTFLGRQQMVEMMSAAGFTQITQHPLTFGVAVAYVGLVK